MSANPTQDPLNEPISSDITPEPTPEPNEPSAHNIRYDESFVNEIVDKAMARLEKKGRAGRKEVKASEKDAKILNVETEKTQNSFKIFIGLFLALSSVIVFYNFKKLKSKETQKNENQA